jgi:hypothetical protein
MDDNGAFARPFAYSGICAYESTDPGTHSWKGKYNGLSGLPGPDRNRTYYCPFTDHSYDYLGFPARTFKTFRDIGVDAGNSRFYDGIHYQPSIDTGLIQGTRVGMNILSKLTSSEK